MNLNDIKILLKKMSIEFKVLHDSEIHENIEYQFSSLRAPTDRGIYFVESNFNLDISTLKNSIILCDQVTSTHKSNILILVEEPQLVHYKMSESVIIKKKPTIHQTAIIDSEAIIGKEVNIGPFSIIGKCVLKEGVDIRNHVVIEDNVTIFENTIIDSNSVIGAEGLSWIWDKEGNRIRQPQLGGVVIERDCYVGTDVTIVRGSLSENTKIGLGTLIAHGTKIGHGTVIGKQVHIANNVSLAGNSNISARAFLGSACVISSHVTIPEGAIVGAGAVVTKSFSETHITLAGVPAKIISSNNFSKKPKGAPKPFKN